MAAPLIVIVNDDSTVLEIMRELLQDEGYRAVVWPGGDGAVELLKREPPALLVLDVRMEQVDAGMAVLQMLRLDPATRAIPVIVCSADAIFVRENGPHLEAKGCRLLLTPFDVADLLGLVTAAIGPANVVAVAP